MLRNGMGRQVLEGELMHSQPQDGMCCCLQATASFAGEMANEEVQAPLPAHNVGDREGDLAGVPAAVVCNLVCAPMSYHPPLVLSACCPLMLLSAYCPPLLLSAFCPLM